MDCPKCNGLLVREEFNTSVYPIHEDTIRCVNCGFIIYKKQEVEYDPRRV